MIDSEIILSILKIELKSAGFRRKRNSWYRLSNDLIQTLNLQKSSWGNQYYVNLGIDYYDGSFLYPKEYSFPPEYQFGLRLRADDILKDIECSVLDFEHERTETDSETEEWIRSIVRGCIRYFDRIDSLSKLKQEVQNDKEFYSYCFMSIPMRKRLNL